jgi:hypothetical protein
MNDELKKKLVERILNRLSSQKFAKWYSDGGNFDRWICGDLTAPTHEQIVSDIETLFLHNL